MRGTGVVGVDQKDLKKYRMVEEGKSKGAENRRKLRKWGEEEKWERMGFYCKWTAHADICVVLAKENV